MIKITRLFVVAVIAAILSTILTPLIASAQSPRGGGFRDRSKEVDRALDRVLARQGGAKPAQTTTTTTTTRRRPAGNVRASAPECPEAQQLKDDKGKVVDCCEHGKVVDKGKERCVTDKEWLTTILDERDKAKEAERQKKIDEEVQKKASNQAMLFFIIFTVIVGIGVAVNFYFDNSRKKELKTDINRVGKTAQEALATAQDHEDRLDKVEQAVEALAGGRPPNRT